MSTVQIYKITRNEYLILNYDGQPERSAPITTYLSDVLPLARPQAISLVEKLNKLPETRQSEGRIEYDYEPTTTFCTENQLYYPCTEIDCVGLIKFDGKEIPLYCVAHQEQIESEVV